MNPSQCSSSPQVALTKEPEEVWGSIDLGHGSIGVIRQDLGVLRPLELVEQLSAQHDIEILLDASHHLVNSIFPGDRELCKACCKGSAQECPRGSLAFGRPPKSGGSSTGTHIWQGNLSGDLKIYSHRDGSNSRPPWKMGSCELSLRI